MTLSLIAELPCSSHLSTLSLWVLIKKRNQICPAWWFTSKSKYDNIFCKYSENWSKQHVPQGSLIPALLTFSPTLSSLKHFSQKFRLSFSFCLNHTNVITIKSTVFLWALYRINFKETVSFKKHLKYYSRNFGWGEGQKACIPQTMWSCGNNFPSLDLLSLLVKWIHLNDS